MLTKLKIVLIALVCWPAWAVAQDNSQSTLANTWSNYKDLYEKSKTMYSSVIDNGKEEISTFKNSLKSLTDALEKDDISIEQLQSLVEQVQSSANELKDNEAVENVKKDFESLKNSAQQAKERFQDVKENGLVYSMPVGFKRKFGNFSIKCSLDSLRFLRGDNTLSEDEDVTLVNADLRLGLPFVTSSGDSSHIVHFSGKDIRLAGANSESKVFLESNHRVTLMKDKVAIELMPQRPTTKSELGMCTSTDDKTWVSFNCNGIQDMNLVGRFIFSNAFISAASDKATTPTASNTATENRKVDEHGTVYAYFNIHGGEFLTSVCFSDSFKVKGCGDFVFTVLDAIVDLSDSLNASGFAFPSGYWDENKEAGLKEEAWTGFFLRKMNVHFPKELDLNDSKDKSGNLEISNVLIDDYGFTGSFLLTNFIDKGNYDKQGNKKSNPGLSLAIDTIGVQFWQGDFTSGLISGNANVPFLGNKETEKDSVVEGKDLTFRGFIGYNPTADHYTYNATLKLEHETEFKVPFTKVASIDITAGELNIHNTDTTKKVIATLALDGSLNIESKLSLKGVRFEELKFSNRNPNIDVKSLSLIGTAGFSYAGLSIQLNGLSWSPKDGWKKDIDYNTDLAELKKLLPNVNFDGLRPDGNGKVNINDLKNLKGFDADVLKQTLENILGLDARIKLVPGNNTLAADLGIDVNSLFNDLGKWKFSGLKTSKICLEADFSAFRFAGCVEQFEDDTTYGDGFRGYVEMTLKELGFGIDAQACFGKVKYKDRDDKFHYWFAKASVEFSKTPIMVFPPCVMLKSFSGGAYQCMAGKSILDNVGNPQKIKLTNVNDYVPTPDIKFGFIAGVGLYIGNDKLVNANVELEMNFNDNWGVNQIKFIGLASVMTTLTIKDSTASGTISGWLAAEYNRKEHKFATQAGVDIAFGKVLTGHGTMDMYTGPDGWHFYLGTNKNPNTLEFIKILKARSYFMLGKVPRRLEPMNETVANYYKVTSSQAEGKDGDIESAKGFAFGLDIHAGSDVSSKHKIFFASFAIDGGCDLLIRDNDCGKAKWRASGDTYVLASGKAGVEVRIKIPFRKKKLKKKFNIIDGSLHAIMMGTVPAPAYATGTAGMKVKVLFIRIPNLEFSFSVGDKKCI